MRAYRNVFHRTVLDLAPGEEGELELSEAEEAEYLRQGRLEILDAEYLVVGPRRVFETEPGKTFSAALQIGQERALVEAGHIELADRVRSKKRGGGRARSR